MAGDLIPADTLHEPGYLDTNPRYELSEEETARYTSEAVQYCVENDLFDEHGNAVIAVDGDNPWANLARVLEREVLDDAFNEGESGEVHSPDMMKKQYAKDEKRSKFFMLFNKEDGLIGAFRVVRGSMEGQEEEGDLGLKTFRDLPKLIGDKDFVEMKAKYPDAKKWFDVATMVMDERYRGSVNREDEGGEGAKEAADSKMMHASNYLLKTLFQYLENNAEACATIVVTKDPNDDEPKKGETDYYQFFIAGGMPFKELGQGMYLGAYSAFCILDVADMRASIVDKLEEIASTFIADKDDPNVYHDVEASGTPQNAGD